MAIDLLPSDLSSRQKDWIRKSKGVQNMAERVGIVVDSAADFPVGIAEKLDLHVIPIHLFVDGEEFLHGVNISNSEALAAMRANKEVRTSPPYPSECSDLYDKLLQQYDRILSFHVSAALSNCFQSATNALSILSEDLASRIVPIDTRSVSVGQSMIVLKALGLIRKGFRGEALNKTLRTCIQQSHLFFTVANLYWLKRVDKVNIFSSIVGNLLDLKPVVILNNGKLEVVSRHRGSGTATEAMVRLCEEIYHGHPRGHDIWIAQADAMERAITIMAQLADRLEIPPERIRIVEVGPSISAHSGPGSICVAMVPKI